MEKPSRAWLTASLLAMTVSVTSRSAAQAPAIGARSCHAMTYAPSQGGVVAMGGARACGVDVVRDSLVWSWNGARWAPVGDAFSGRREDALVAYDARRRALVLYGGRMAGAVHTDTWELVGGRWQQRSSSAAMSPGAVEHAAMAYDERRGRTVLFGGGSRDGRMFDGTWEWNGADWRRAAVGGPAARVGHAMASSSADSGVVMYGGFNATGPFRDLWRWDGAAWMRLDSAGPAETEGPALVSTERGPMLVGAPAGATGSTLGVWLWTNRRWERLDAAATTGPRPRVGQGLAYDAARRRLVLFGGYFPNGDRASAETWEFDGRAWRLVSDGAR